MRVPVAWLRELMHLPADVDTKQLAARLTAFDLKLDTIDQVSDIQGPLVVGRVLSVEDEPQTNGRTIHWCSVDVGEKEPRGIVCGAQNFGAGDHVVVALPGAELPGGTAIAARKTYGHVSDGMICSPPELGLDGDPGGIIVLDGAPEPGDDAVALLGLYDEVLDLEVNPDRAYALSLRGVARDASQAFGVPFTDPAERDVPADGDSYPVRVDDPESCPVFVAREVRGFDPSRPTPEWMARRVEQAGMRSISLAVDVSNYVMLELGQPNHAYDRAKLSGDIVVRRAEPGEKITTLDDVVRTLDPEDLLITDDAGPVGIAGVMGAAHVEMDENTTDIVIEAAFFDPPTIGRSVRRHKLPSEASKRNERGVDTELQARAAQRVAELLVEHGGGTIEPGLTVVGRAPVRAAVSIPEDLPSRISGVDIDGDTAAAALAAGGGEVRHADGRITLTPPSWRFDLTGPYDLVEDVLRVVGYDQVPSVLPPAPVGHGLTKAQELRRRAGMVLAGAGLVEVKTFPFAGPVDFDRLGLSADDARRRQVLLENPLSAEQPGMTTTLLAGVLATAGFNVGRGHTDVQIVETGRVFIPQPDEPTAPIYGVDRRPTDAELDAFVAALPHQPQHVAYVLSGERVHSGWAGRGRAASWSDAIAIAHRVAAALHLRLTVEPAELAPWHPGRCAALMLDGVVVGHAGEVHPRVAREYGLHGRAAAGELDLDALIDAAPDVGPRPEFSIFPVAKEDLALVVDASVASAVVHEALAHASPLIESVRLFDVYTGDQVAPGSKSLAFALRLRAPDRTLTDDDITAARDAAVAAAAAAAGATLRT
ncbi:phenylalanine--tRNA ligase subunit beta [Aeromicrobium sp.]|uniref:phenylalanine--tRNA ligase subunit beta n=1 Tax=Aeromicrobium sp. TaxID=1871063 RepID=UPI003D6C52E3